MKPTTATTTMAREGSGGSGVKGVTDIEHPPHVHRLLRLIREGTPSHASKASVLLGRYAASCCHSSAAATTTSRTSSSSGNDDDINENDSIASRNPGLIIWDLIGRLVGGDGISGNDDVEDGDGAQRDGNTEKGKRQSKTKSKKNQTKRKQQRPTSGLFDSNWTTRSNCALALERVARCLPLEDRRHFFEGGDESDMDNGVSDGDNERNVPKSQHSGEDISLWMNVYDLHRCNTICNNHNVKDEQVVCDVDATVTSSENDKRHAPNQLDTVVQRGRLLLSSSGESYNWDCDDEVNEYIRERAAMQNLDAAALDHTQSKDDNSDYSMLRRSFLMRRVALQRQILARRLGLGGILNAPIIADVGHEDSSAVPDKVASSANVKKRRIIDDIVDDDDLAPTKKRGGKTNDNWSRQVGNAKRSKTSRSADRPESKNNNQPNDCRGMSIRALLVLESNNSEVDDCDSYDRAQRRRRHRNPQTLLGSELAYRTFDPDWTVRHGALLGTMALLRAWRVHDTLPSRMDTSKSATKNAESKARKFGNWPHDILARCICMLVLDKFSDFSGTSSCDNDADDADNIASGAVVAPVREMAAQIIALLLEAACPDTCRLAHDLLSQLYAGKYPRAEQIGNKGWEIRHGVLLAWKYICAMKLFNSHGSGKLTKPSLTGGNVVAQTLRPLSGHTNMELQENDPHRYSVLNNLIKQSIRGLSDSSDDNRAVAAQVIQQTLLLDTSIHSVDIVKESSQPLWQAIIQIRSGVTSCAADLLQLLAELLSRRCDTFVLCLQEMRGSISLDSVLHKLIEYIDDDSTNVKTACFSALSVVAEPISNTILDGESSIKSESDSVHLQSIAGCTTALCRILTKLFETYYIPEYFCAAEKEFCGEMESSGGTLSNKRDQAWLAVVAALALLTESYSTAAQTVVDECFATLVLRYFDIIMTVEPTKDEKMNPGRSHQLKRVVATVGFGEYAFCFRVASAQALALVFIKIYSESQPCFLTNTIGSALESPWFSQCEAGYLLHTVIASSVSSISTGHGSGDLPFFSQYFPSMLNTFDSTPMCTRLVENPVFSRVLDDPIMQSICDHGLSLSLNSAHRLSSKAVVQIWTKAFEQRGINLLDLHKAVNTSLTKPLMRLAVTISGAIIACGCQHLPPKVTPLIRALMTSLKNEESDFRRGETCRYISKLVSMLSMNPLHSKARDKLLDNVCNLACSSDSNQKGAEHVIELLVGTERVEDLSPLWQRLMSLMDDNYPNSSEEEITNSTHMLNVVSRSMSKGCSSFTWVLESFVTSAVDIACTSGFEALHDQACRSVLHLCQIDFNATMDQVKPTLLLNISDMQNDQRRLGASKLLLSILHDFEVLAAPYVLELLPTAMRSMTDSVEECSRLAAFSFAILVRIAPLAAGHVDECGNDQTSSVVRHLILGKPLPPCDVPDIVLAHLKKSGTTLRPYQMEGIAWLSFLADVHLNGALCDDMGLGKTLTSLIAVAISHHGESGESKDCASSNSLSSKKSLVVCPASVVGHWMSEIKRFFPSNQVFNPFDFTGSAKARRVAWKERLHQSNIVVTSYSVLRTDADKLDGVFWEWCILDEGHLVKNPKTSTSKASRRLKACHKLILTGTPIQNNVHEMWATFDFLMPNFLGNESSFVKEFVKPIVKSQGSDASSADINQGMESLKILHQQVLPFVLRREKSQVMRELPPKIITDVPCTLSCQQHTMYQQVLNASGTKEALDIVMNSLDNTEVWSSGDVAHPPKLGSDVLTSLLQLRLICTHPLLHSLFASKSKSLSTAYDDCPRSVTRLDCSGKLSVLNDLLRHAGIAEPEITAADNDASGFLLDANESISDDTSDIDYLGTDNDNTFEVSDFPEQAANSSKCLIFAQFTQSLDIVERLLFEPHMPSLQYLRLDGKVPTKERITIADRFNQDSNIKVLLLTTKVGGLGLNLTGADKVIFLEPDWNPFVDLQAMDRAHRIGQTKSVNVYRLITSNTIEEKIMELQRRKQATSEAVVNAENSTMYSMGTDRLLDIFTCRSNTSMTSSSPGEVEGDSVLSYLDDATTKEYSSLSVAGFMRGLT